MGLHHKVLLELNRKIPIQLDYCAKPILVIFFRKEKMDRGRSLDLGFPWGVGSVVCNESVRMPICRIGIFHF